MSVYRCPPGPVASQAQGDRWCPSLPGGTGRSGTTACGVRPASLLGDITAGQRPRTFSGAPGGFLVIPPPSDSIFGRVVPFTDRAAWAAAWSVERLGR